MRRVILAMVVIGVCVLTIGLVLGLATRSAPLAVVVGGPGFTLMAFAQAARMFSLAAASPHRDG